MSFSQYAGIAIIPTLSRIVLCAAFVTAGYNKLFSDSLFTHEQATILQNEWGVDVELAGGTEGVNIQEVSLQVETGDLRDLPPAGPTGEGEGIEQPPSEGAEPAPEEIQEGEAPAEVEGEAMLKLPPLPAGDYKARRLYHVALSLHEADMPYAYYGAWASAIIELAAGILIFIGFLSRLSGLVLAATMAVAFYVLSMVDNSIFTTNPFEFAQNLSQYNLACKQLGLGVLALGVFMTGAGPISLDALFFGGGRRAGPEGSRQG